jgi:RNA polymerase sigma-70 factor (ECF subfamily)
LRKKPELNGIIFPICHTGIYTQAILIDATMNKLLKLIRKSSKSTKFDEWIHGYHGALYKHALWMVGSHDIAQEMVQEAFFQAWLSMDSLNDKDKALPWLLTILRRTVYREQRCQYRNRETVEALKQLDLEETQQDAFALLEIYNALEFLSPKLRDTFLLYHLHGFSYEEISAQLEIPTGTVMSRISRAREALQKHQNTGDEKVIDFRSIKRGFQNEG